jgi:hypothetical protein
MVTRLQRSIHAMKTEYPGFNVAYEAGELGDVAVWRGVVQPGKELTSLSAVLQDLEAERPVRVVQGEVMHHPDCKVAHSVHALSGRLIYWRTRFELEDRRTDFGSIRAGTTDIPLLLLAEFGLVYGNDWTVVPYNLPVGTFAEIKGLIVTDVFGEMTNMVWGVEERIGGVLGTSADGFDRATALSAYFQQQAPPSTVIPEPLEATIRYVLGTTVPENWIPFIAVRKPGSQRLIRLQRASMPRLTDAIPGTRVEPRGAILRVGLDRLDVREPYFLHEEEVPRAGAIVTRGFQRTRWFDGKVYTWMGRKKETGRGQGASGLEFDRITPVERPR